MLLKRKTVLFICYMFNMFQRIVSAKLTEITEETKEISTTNGRAKLQNVCPIRIPPSLPSGAFILTS